MDTGQKPKGDTKMGKEKKKVTKNPVGNVYETLDLWKDFMDRHGVDISVTGIVFSNEGAKGRNPLFDISEDYTEDIFAYWKDEAKGIIEISAPEPGYEIKAPEDMGEFFMMDEELPDAREIAETIDFLDVSHLDVSQTTEFCSCFAGFGSTEHSEIIGLGNWDVSRANSLCHMFCGAFSKNDCVKLDLTSWDVSRVEEFIGMFYEFASNASEVTLKGVESWKPAKMKYSKEMFMDFAPKSDCHLDLQSWRPYTTKCLFYDHYNFATGSHSLIKEPQWLKRDDE